MEKPTVIFDSNGPSGNIFAVLGLVSQALRKVHRISDFNECRDKVMASHSYEAALEAVREYVDLVDISG